MKYLIEIEVDEEKLKACKCEGMSETDIADMSIEGMIIEEMGWVGHSGIFLNSIKEVESDLTDNYVENEIGEKITEIINQDGENKTDGQCIDEIINYLTTLGLYKNK